MKVVYLTAILVIYKGVIKKKRRGKLGLMLKKKLHFRICETRVLKAVNFSAASAAPASASAKM